MIDRIIEFSGRNRFVVFLIVAVATMAGLWSMRTIPLDAIPDLSDTQVIVYSRWDRSPDIIEDQVTYPIVTALLGAPKVKAIRGFSDFGFSYVYVIFEDGTDIYWARSRVLEYLSKILPRLPAGRADRARPRRDRRRLGLPVRAGRPHAASTRWPSCARSRTGTCATTCKSVPGVAEVAPIGGFVQQYQVTGRSRTGCSAYDLPIDEGGRRGPRGQQRGRRPAARVRAAPSTWCAAAATPSRRRTSSNIVLETRRARHAGACARRRHGDARARDPPRRRRPRRPGRRGRRHRRDAPRRERAQRHRAREGRSSTSSSPACPRAWRSSPPTTART